MNNNGEVDNGVYNKFVKQSTDGSNKLTTSVKDNNKSSNDHLKSCQVES